MPEFDRLADEFIRLHKIAVKRYRWQGKRRADYMSAAMSVAVPGRPELVGSVRMTTRRQWSIQKHSFVLVFGGERLLGLDVNPGRGHTNFATAEIVTGTHWHIWPSTDAVVDARDLFFVGWLDAFLRRANISYPYRHRGPPQGVQLPLL